MKLRVYEITVLLFVALAVWGLADLIQNSAGLWLIPLFFWVRFNHLCLSLHHRMISHVSFTPRRTWIHRLVIVCSVFQANHSPLKFALAHRHHHRHSDTDRDIHGPCRGLGQTLAWEWDLESQYTALGMRFPRDLARDRFLVLYDRYYYLILALVSALIYLASAEFFWYVFAPGTVLWRLEANLFVNYLCHRGPVWDPTQNRAWAALLTMGEGWHRNHHLAPSNHRFGHGQSQPDITAWIIERWLK